MQSKALQRSSNTANYFVFTYNLVHNILELYNVLVQVRLAISQTKRDIWYSKLGIWIASRVAEWLKS